MNAELILLLQYHALHSYGLIGTKKDPIITLATNDANKFDLPVETAGDNVTLVTGRDFPRVTDVVIDTVPLSIFAVDNVPLPIEVFGTAQSSAPIPVVSLRGPIANVLSTMLVPSASPTGSPGAEESIINGRSFTKTIEFLYNINKKLQMKGVDVLSRPGFWNLRLVSWFVNWF